MNLSFSLFSAFLFYLAAVPATAQESVNCTDELPKTKVQEILCATPDLMASDADIRETYRTYLSSVPGLPFLRSNQTEWEKNLSQCPEKKCLEAMYKERKNLFQKSFSVKPAEIILSGGGIARKDFPFSPSAAAAADDGSIWLTVQTSPYAGYNAATDTAVLSNPRNFPGFMLARYASDGKEKEYLTYIDGLGMDFPEKIRLSPQETIWILGRMNSPVTSSEQSLPVDPNRRPYFLSEITAQGKKIKEVRPLDIFSKITDFHMTDIGDLWILGIYQDKPVLAMFNTRLNNYEHMFFLPKDRWYTAFSFDPSNPEMFWMAGQTATEGQAGKKAFQTKLPPARISAFAGKYSIVKNKFEKTTYLNHFGIIRDITAGKNICITGRSIEAQHLKLLLTINAFQPVPKQGYTACLNKDLSEIVYFSFLNSRPLTVRQNKEKLSVIGY